MAAATASVDTGFKPATGIPGLTSRICRLSPDGKWVYFMSSRSGSGQIWKARADGREPIQLTAGGGYQALESPDGKLLFYAKERGRPGIWSVPVGGGPEVPVLEAARHNAWAVAEGGIYYIDTTMRTLRQFP